MDGERALATCSEPMTRGHQERLGPMVREVMLAAGLEFDAVQRIAVTVGPGSFTGLRVGLAFAKGLGLALGLPVAGIGTLEALAVGSPERCASVVDAGRGRVYVQAFLDGAAVSQPASLEIEEAGVRLRDLLGDRARLIGPGAPLLAALLPLWELEPRAAPDPLALARLAATRPLQPAQPLYLRAPDATPKALRQLR